MHNSNYGTFQEARIEDENFCHQFAESSIKNLLGLIKTNKVKEIDIHELVKRYDGTYKLEQKIDAILFTLNQLSKDLKDTEKQRYYKSLVYCLDQISIKSNFKIKQEASTGLFYSENPNRPESIFCAKQINADEKTPLLQPLQK
ncbi:hypothetical protein L3V79_08055 [Thiotrichales bacterium 19S9-12]|nr:hypothetical protein [Thiotrichales bacterium 19S9-11]MCF6812305.1 hypothetical protein [Thiotrichales bacterium 19S9-12]